MESGSNFSNPAQAPAAETLRLVRATIESIPPEESDRLTEAIVALLVTPDHQNEMTVSALTEVAGGFTEIWLKLLEHFRWRVRIGSMKVLAARREFLAIEPLIQMLNAKPDDSLRVHAEKALAEILTKRSPTRPLHVASVTSLLTLPSRRVVRESVRHLKTMSPEDRIHCIKAGLRNRHFQATAEVVAAVPRFDAFEAIPVVGQLLQHSQFIQHAAHEALLGLIESNAILLTEHRQRLSETLLIPEPGIALRSLERLAGVASFSLSNWLENIEIKPFPEISSDGFGMISEYCRNICGSLPVIQLCLSECFRRYGSFSDIPTLLPCLTCPSSETNRHISETICLLLGLRRHRVDDVQIALSCLKCRDEKVVIAALETLAVIGDESAVQALNDILGAISPAVDDAAAKLADLLARERQSYVSPTSHSSSVENPERISRIIDRMRTRHPDGVSQPQR